MRKANAALTTVIVVSAFLLVGGITLVQISSDLSRAGKSHEASLILQIRANNCMEEVMLLLKSNPTYSGTRNYAEDDFSCTAIVSNDIVVTTRIISVTATFDSSTINQSRKVDTTTKPHTIINQ